MLVRNHDGVVSDIEMTSKSELAFKALDRNSDGFISKREFTEISKSLTKEQVMGTCHPDHSKSASFVQVEAVLAKFDSDGDGKLSYSEFKKLINKEKK